MHEFPVKHFAEGTDVLVWVPEPRISGVKRPAKVSYRWSGPYPVLSRLVDAHHLVLRRGVKTSLSNPSTALPPLVGRTLLV